MVRKYRHLSGKNKISKFSQVCKMSTDSNICHTSVVTECVGLAQAARPCGRDARVGDIARRRHTPPTGRGSGRRLVLATTSVCVCRVICD